MLADCGINISHPTIVWCDNLSTISIAKNPTLLGRTKDIDIRYHFIRELVADGAISLQHCTIKDQLIDIFT